MEQRAYTMPGGDSHIKKKTGMLVGHFKELLKGTKILFCGRGLEMFSPVRGTNSYITNYCPAIFFCRGRRSGLMVSALVPGASGPGSSPDRG